MGRHRDNVVNLLYRRELGFYRHHPLTHDLKIVRTLLASRNRQFRCIGTVKSRQPVTYNAGLLFTDSFTVCRSCVGEEVRKKNRFSRLYGLERAVGGHLNDAMLFSIPYPWSTPKPTDDFPTLLRLTNTYLERRRLEDGAALESINLGPDARFKHLAWNEPGFSFHIKSSRRIFRGRSEEKMTAINFIMFTIGPLAPWLVFHISSETLRLDVGTSMSVKEFDANIDNFLLVITLNKRVRLYSFQRLMDINGPIPVPPTFVPNVGFSPNLVITEMPPCLMIIPTRHSELVTFGGFPLHVLYYHEDGNTHLRRVSDQALVHVFQPSQVAIDLETAVFANTYDDIIYWRSSNAFRIFRLANDTLSQIFDLDCTRSRPGSSDSGSEVPMHVSRYGRSVKRKQRTGYDVELSSSVLYLAYDDDLDLLALLVSRASVSGELFLHAEFYDCVSGRPFSSVRLQETMEDAEDREWTLQADLTFLVLTSQRTPNEFLCSIYELLEV